MRGHPDPLSAARTVDLLVPRRAALQIRLGTLGHPQTGSHQGPRTTVAAGTGHSTAESHRSVGRTRQVRTRIQSNRLEDRPATRTQRRYASTEIQ